MATPDTSRADIGVVGSAVMGQNLTRNLADHDCTVAVCDRIWVRTESLLAGEEGVRHGPAIIAGGAVEAWPEIGPMLASVAARADDGAPCWDRLGPDGVGHYVKLVHNGIEYGDTQVLAEAYSLLQALGHCHDEMSAILRKWGRGVLDHFLIEVTADSLAFRDEDGEPLVGRILEVVGQEGTGRWTVISAMELAQPTSLIAEGVLARIGSALKAQRVRAAERLPGPSQQIAAGALSPSDVRDAAYAATIVCYAQGLMLLAGASERYGWGLDLGRVASIWRGGCIIRARLLNDILAAFDPDPSLTNLLIDPFFASALADTQGGLRRVVAQAAVAGVPVPVFSAAWAYQDAIRSETGPANLLQAQRDDFGAHTYERIDRPCGQAFHTDRTGRGGTATAGSYDA